MTQHITCVDCVYNAASVDANTKEIIRICIRFPPAAHMLGTQQGIAVSTAYPMIKNDLIACGEWDDGADINIEDNHHFPTGVNGN